MGGELTWLRIVSNGRLCISNVELSASATSVILCLKKISEVASSMTRFVMSLENSQIIFSK
jgi:hypothetical protein